MKMNGDMFSTYILIEESSGRYNLKKVVSTQTIAFLDGVKGTIIDFDTGEPLSDVIVTLDFFPTKSNSNGEYEVQIPAAPLPIRFHIIGYKKGGYETNFVKWAILGPSPFATILMGLDVQMKKQE